MNPLRSRTRFPTTIETDRLERLRALSEETHVPMSRLMDEALDHLFRHEDQKKHRTSRKRA